MFKTTTWEHNTLGETTYNDIFKVNIPIKTLKRKRDKRKVECVKKNTNIALKEQIKNTKLGAEIVSVSSKSQKASKITAKPRKINKNRHETKITFKNSKNEKDTINVDSCDERTLVKKIKKRNKNKKGHQNKLVIDKVDKNEEININKLHTTKDKINITLPKISQNLNINKRKQIKRQEKLSKLRKTLQLNKKTDKPVLSLREKMILKLKAARFRYLNEQIYTTNSKDAQKLFEQDPKAFQAYHNGYRQQVDRWPVNPVDNIIDSIKKMPKNYIIADFGCGEGKLSRSVQQKVYSFDLVAVNDTVIACDMAHVPLDDHCIDVVVFCLSLMGTNLQDYLLEANRVLKVGGLLKIAEVESRFDDVDNFIKGVDRFGFKNTWKDLSYNLFYFMDFKKEFTVKNKKKLPTISLQPCLYKKR